MPAEPMTERRPVAELRVGDRIYCDAEVIADVDPGEEWGAPGKVVVWTTEGRFSFPADRSVVVTHAC